MCDAEIGTNGNTFASHLGSKSIEAIWTMNVQNDHYLYLLERQNRAMSVQSVYALYSPRISANGQMKPGKQPETDRGNNGRKEGSHDDDGRLDLILFASAQQRHAVSLTILPCTYLQKRGEKQEQLVMPAKGRRRLEPSHYYLSLGEGFRCLFGPLW